MSTAKSINVFLVADHQIVLWGLEQLVRSVAPRMAVAGTAASCAELFADLAFAQPDVVLLDLDLDNESALDCLEKLDRHSGVKVLALTGSSDQEIHQRAIIGGAHGIVQKQQPVDVILRAIEKVSDGEIWLDRINLGRVMHALSRGPARDPETTKIAKLTAKEQQIVTTVVTEKGGRCKAVADKLHISEHTLRNHLTTIYKKLNLEGRMELYIYATSHAHLMAPHRFPAVLPKKP